MAHKKRWFFTAVVIGLAALLVTFAAAAVLAEGAVHPLLKRRAFDTAGLADRVARASGALASQVSITTQDGVKLDGWWLVSPHSNGRAVMVCHGVGDSAFGALGFAGLFLNHGYSVLVPESRGHGESGGFVTYGVLESGDVVEWVNWMRGRGVTSVFGLGESLGASILIQAVGAGAPFQAVVAECPYSSFEAIADERVSRVVGRPLALLLVREGVLYIRVRYHVNLERAATDSAITKAHTPILLIHGLDDQKTSPQNSMRLARLNPVWTTLWLVPHAGHTGAYAQDPKAFEQKVLARFD